MVVALLLHTVGSLGWLCVLVSVTLSLIVAPPLQQQKALLLCLCIADCLVAKKAHVMVCRAKRCRVCIWGVALQLSSALLCLYLARCSISLARPVCVMVWWHSFALLRARARMTQQLQPRASPYCGPAYCCTDEQTSVCLAADSCPIAVLCSCAAVWRSYRRSLRQKLPCRSDVTFGVISVVSIML
jgi:hypothetical protein